MNKTISLLDWAREVRPKPSARLWNFLSKNQEVFSNIEELMEVEPEYLLNFKDMGKVTLKELYTLTGKPLPEKCLPKKDTDVFSINITLELPKGIGIKVNGNTI